MPKRILDSTLLSSPSLARCSPRAQDAFPRFILLMDDFGCADANPRRLVGEGWPLRDDVSESDVWTWLEEYVAAGMACLWTEKERRWVYLTGWNGPHGQKVRAEYDPNAPKGTPGRHGSKRKTPVPPAELVAAVMSGARRVHDGKPPGVDREDAPETLSDSVPAREMTGNVAGNEVSRVFPAPAVPVADAGSPHTRPAPRLVSPFATGADPYPLATAVLAALWERSIDAAPPAEKSAARVEAAIREAGIPTATERLAAVLADPQAKRPLTYHVEAIRGTRAKRQTHGDLGSELQPWPSLLTEDEKRRVAAEYAAVSPEYADAPIGITGASGDLATVNERWRAVAEARRA